MATDDDGDDDSDDDDDDEANRESAVWMYGCTVVSYVTDRRSDHD